jgi:hypothetical protein
MKRTVVVVFCAILIVAGAAVSSGQGQQTPQPQQPAEDVKIPPDQLDALVAPIAIFPDPLLSQTLAASTYPLEIMQLQQWLEKNPGLKDQALVDAVEKQSWDPSVKAMAAVPQLVKRLADDIQWTTDLGNAFLAQQKDVMDAVQRMRMRAKDAGTLESNEHQTVETRTEGDKSVVVVEQAQPNVVYVPDYNPAAVFGAPVYPYPSIYYPPYGGVLAASAISWGVGLAMGAAWGGGWGWGANWGGGDININRNNTFNRNTNISGNRWQHNAAHRGGTPYSNRATANRFGSNARGQSLASRQKAAQGQIARQKGNLGSVAGRTGGARAGAGTRAGGGARAGAGNLGGARAGGGVGGRSSISGGNRVGNRSVGSGAARGNRGGFSGGSGGFSGSAARASRSRGSRSFSGGGRSRGGGGRSRGGGGRSRGGGGRSRGGGGRR